MPSPERCFPRSSVWWGLTPKQRELLGFDRDVAHSTVGGYLNDLLDATYAWLACFGIIAVAIRLMRSRYGTSPSLLAEGEQVTEPLPKPMRKDKNGQEKKTLNVQVFGRRKARRKTGRPRGTPESKPPTGPPTWAVTPPQSAGDSVK